MEDLMDQTKATIRNFSKSVSKLNLYSDRLILEAEKGSVISSKKLRPSDEKLVHETTKAAIKFILQYSELLDTVKEVEYKKTILPKVEYPEFRATTMKTLDNLKMDMVKLKLFQEYSNKLVDSLDAADEEDDSIDCSSSFENYSFS